MGEFLNVISLYRMLHFVPSETPSAANIQAEEISSFHREIQASTTSKFAVCVTSWKFLHFELKLRPRRRMVTVSPDLIWGWGEVGQHDREFISFQHHLWQGQCNISIFEFFIQVSFSHNDLDSQMTSFT